MSVPVLGKALPHADEAARAVCFTKRRWFVSSRPYFATALFGRVSVFDAMGVDFM